MVGEEVDPVLKEKKFEFLAEMEPRERFEYSCSVVNWLAAGVGTVADAKGKIQQSKRLREFGEALTGKAEEVVVVAMYTIKPEFRAPWMNLLGTLVGMGKKQSQESQL